MQNIAEIRHHTNAAEQTKKITNAMYLISAARMNKLIARMSYNTRYLTHVQDAMRHVLASCEPENHPYMHERSSGENTYIVFAGEKGMAGSYHADLLKFAHACIREQGLGRVLCFGAIAANYFRKQGITPAHEYHFSADGPTLESTRHLEQDVFRWYDETNAGAVYLIHPRFVSAADCQPHMQRLLPLDVDSFGERTDKEEMLYHPSAEEMFHLLIPQYSVCILYGALMQTYAGEHSARMYAMQNATKNADSLLKELQGQYNMARQSAITQEIIEITNAVKALNG